MRDRILVCPPQASAMQHLAGQRVVIPITDSADVPHVTALARQNDLLLYCIFLETDLALTAVDLGNLDRNMPCALSVPRMGPTRDLLRRLPTLRHHNIRIYLPADRVETYISVRVLSSLGITTAVDLRGDVADWEALADLMTYALLGLCPHGDISPFAEVARAYSPRGYTDYGSVYFEDPTRYLHLDSEGRVALTASALAEKSFIADRFDADLDLESLDTYWEHRGRFRDHFMKLEGCACCPGFRICLGKYHKPAAALDGCSGFHAELMDVVERRQQAVGPRKTVWHC